MTIPSTPVQSGPYPCDGVTTTFPFYFKAFSASYCGVMLVDLATGDETPLLYGADFSVVLNADQQATPGGNVLTSIAHPATVSLTVYSNVPYDQPQDLPAAGAFPVESIEWALDYLATQIKQLTGDFGSAVPLGEAVRVPHGETINALPDAASRAGGTIVFDEFGNIFTVPYVEPVAAVTRLIAGTGITLTPPTGVGDVTVTNSAAGVGGGTVTSTSVVTANGVSGSVANATTTPAITLVLGAIVPTSVAASSFVRAGSGVTYGTLGSRQNGAYGGAGANSGYDDIVVENGGTIAGLTFLTPASASAAIAFGDPASNVVGRLVYDHATDIMALWAGGVSQLALHNTTGLTLRAGLPLTMTGTANVGALVATGNVNAAAVVATGNLSGILNHLSGYGHIHPYNGSYDDGSDVRFFWDGVLGNLNFSRNGGSGAAGVRLVATSFVGSLTGNAATASLATAANAVGSAANSGNATNYVAFVGAASGNQALRTDGGLTYNPSTNTLVTTNLTVTNINGSAYPPAAGTSSKFISADQALIGGSGTYTAVNHGGPRVPDMFKVVFRCTVASDLFAVGEEFDADGATGYGYITCVANATQVQAIQVVAPGAMKRGGAFFIPDPAKFVLRYKCIWIG